MNLLIADDEKFFAENLKQLLSVETSYNIILSFDGDDALSKIMSEDFDAYILDLNMPYISGDKLAKVIANKVISPKIIFISAYSSLANELRINFPQFPILEKPFEIKQLIKLLN